MANMNAPGRYHGVAAFEKIVEVGGDQGVGSTGYGGVNDGAVLGIEGRGSCGGIAGIVDGHFRVSRRKEAAAQNDMRKFMTWTHAGNVFDECEFRSNPATDSDLMPATVPKRSRPPIPR